MVLSALLLLALCLPPEPASHVAAWIVGAPQLGPELVRICRRESACAAIGIHERDAHYGRTAYRRAIRVGLLQPQHCMVHRYRGPAQRWSTRGPWGTIAAYTLGYMGPCLPPEVLDIPLLGAIAAAKRLQAAHRRHAHPRLRSWANLPSSHPLPISPRPRPIVG
jgi:hypothetical protein